MPNKWNPKSEGSKAGQHAAKTAKESIRDVETAAKDIAEFAKSFVESFQKEIKKK